MKERGQEPLTTRSNNMKALLTTLCLLCMPLAASSVNIHIQGTIGKFIHITSSATSATLDLQAHYDEGSGGLEAAEYELSLIDVRSNIRDGYEVKVSTSNNFKLKSDNHAEIDYTLKLRDETESPKGADFNEAQHNNDKLLEADGGIRFSDNSLSNAKLILTTEGSSDFTIDDETFSDTVTVTVTAN